MSNKLSFDFVSSMTQYGIYLGCLVGAVGSIPIGLMVIDMPIGLSMIGLMLLATIYGGVIGTFYGAIAGSASGLTMLLTTRYVFSEIKRRDVYRFTMGVGTLGATLIVFIVGQLWLTNDIERIFTREIPPNAWHSLWIMALVFAVYASQRTASRYLWDSDV